MRSKAPGQSPNRNVLYPLEKATKMTPQELVIELERPSAPQRSCRAETKVAVVYFVRIFKYSYVEQLTSPYVRQGPGRVTLQGCIIAAC